MSDEVSASLGDLIAANLSDYNNQTYVNDTGELFGSTLVQVVDDAYSGTLWLFPAAVSRISCQSADHTRRASC